MTQLQDKSENALILPANLYYKVIIDCCAGTFNEFTETFNSVNSQTLPPQQVIPVHYDGQSEETFTFVQSVAPTYPWVVEEFLDDRADWRDDILLKYRQNSQLFAFIKAGVVLEENFFQNLSDKVLKGGLRYKLIEGDGIIMIPYGVYFITDNTLPLRGIIEEIKEEGKQIVSYECISSEN